MPELKSELLFEMSVTLEEPQNVGATAHGDRRIYYVTGGTFQGPRLRGNVLPGGGDWLLLSPDGVGALDVRATLRTDDGQLIYMHYRGVMHIPPDVGQRMQEGKAVEASEYYFRTTPVYETASEKYGWLNRIVAVGVGTIETREGSSGVSYQVYQIL